MAEIAAGGDEDDLGGQVACECGGCPWCGPGCDKDAAAVCGGQHLCAGCADIGEDE